ncbi:hypothetical protein ACQKOE_14015 [Novosphingobium sp. NPDC080210]|uniref:hypothetical protein n=1 Tax=Novosphingobium sp. NPDC080210 TaxID=3390596 RepID=UPI003CFE3286
MNDMTAVIQPRSDQVNADDFIGGPKSYTIEAVHINPGSEQPVQIQLIGEPRVWRPCKSMSRVLVAAWGPDAKVYAGRSVTLYRDPKVKWGGMEVGGIRISHMSHIERDLMIQLTATKGKRAPHVVKPLAAEVKPLAAKSRQTAEEWAAEHIAAVQIAADPDALAEVMAKGSRPMAKLQAEKPELWAEVNAAYAARRADLEREGKPETEMDEGFADDDGFED